MTQNLWSGTAVVTGAGSGLGAVDLRRWRVSIEPGRVSQGQTPLIVVLTEARPVALTVTTRSCEPTLGVKRQIVNVSTVAPTTLG
jgi:hypothetical protein